MLFWRERIYKPAKIERRGPALAIVLLCLMCGCGKNEKGKHSGDGELSEDEKAPRVEAVSFMGESLFRPVLEPQTLEKLKSDLATAKSAFEERPGDVERLIWFGRRMAYLGRYGEAIAIYTKGVHQHPNDARLLRHRGHRLISIRKLDEAISDLEKAVNLITEKQDEVEPDGMPNKHNIPRSSLHSNIWYHLGLAYYLKADFGNAKRCFEACLGLPSINDDMFCATSHWLYMSCRRLELHDEAALLLEPVREDMEILESFPYHHLLLMYKGLRTPEELWRDKGEGALDHATTGYGVGNWYFYNGDREKAESVWRQVVKGSYWSAFGFIAAEADLSRL